MRLGLALRDAREARELTQVDAGKLVGHSQGWINKIETAQIARVKLADLDKVLDAYGIGSATIDDEDALRLFQRRWELIRSASLGEYDSRRFIRRMLAEHQQTGKG